MVGVVCAASGNDRAEKIIVAIIDMRIASSASV
jgi:hypothetical protein